MNLKKGMLVKILNYHGVEVGTGLYFSTFKPSERGAVGMHLYPIGVNGPTETKASVTHWHHEVLVGGILEWLHTDGYSLIGVKDESR